MSDRSNKVAQPAQAVEALELALGRLGRADLDPLAARGLLVAAQRRLTGRRAQLPRAWRLEPLLLAILSLGQLAWAIARVFAPGH